MTLTYCHVYKMPSSDSKANGLPNFSMGNTPLAIKMT